MGTIFLVRYGRKGRIGHTAQSQWRFAITAVVYFREEVHRYT